jgi:hypothetical protein
VPTVLYPTALVVVHLLPELGQETPDMITFATVPRRLKVEKNDIQSADTIEFELDLEDFPLDPRIIRAVTVEAFIADAGGTGPFWESLRTDVATLRKYAIFAGIIDEVTSQIDSDRVVTMKGRDYSAYLLDAELESKELVYGSKTLVQIIRDLLDQRETTKAIQIETRGDGIERLVPRTYMIRGDAPKIRSVKTLKERDTLHRKKQEGNTAWEVIQEMALLGGVVAYIELDTLVLADPATLNVDDPSSARETHFTLGREIDSYSPCRRMGRRTGVRVIVSSWDVEAGKTRRAGSPKGILEGKLGVLDAGQDQISAAPLGSAGKAIRVNAHARPYVVRGIRDQNQLQAIADCIRVQLEHHEMDVSVDVMRLSDSNGKPLQDLRYGDPVAIDIDANFPSSLASPIEDQIARLLSLGYPVADAEALTKAVNQLHVPYWLNGATYSFTEEEDDSLRVTLSLRSRRPIEVPSPRGTS